MCLVCSVAVVVLVALTLHQSFRFEWDTLTWIGAAAVPILTVGCGLLSRRQKCRMADSVKENSHE